MQALVLSPSEIQNLVFALSLLVSRGVKMCNLSTSRWLQKLWCVWQKQFAWRMALKASVWAVVFVVFGFEQKVMLCPDSVSSSLPAFAVAMGRDKPELSSLSLLLGSPS